MSHFLFSFGFPYSCPSFSVPFLDSEFVFVYVFVYVYTFIFVFVSIFIYVCVSVYVYVSVLESQLRVLVF